MKKFQIEDKSKLPKIKNFKEIPIGTFFIFNLNSYNDYYNTRCFAFDLNTKIENTNLYLKVDDTGFLHWYTNKTYDYDIDHEFVIPCEMVKPIPLLNYYNAKSGKLKVKELIKILIEPIEFKISIL